MLVKRGGKEERAANYPELTGKAEPGDRVLLNTTAVKLGLGSGGFHFVMANERRCAPQPGPGHIVKLRYTPCQIAMLAAEEEGSPVREKFATLDGLGGLPVVACSLHSQVAAVAAGIRAISPSLRVAYLMTDGGALPLAFSRLVPYLKEANLIQVTVTAGHAFGGDWEAVNIYSGLLVSLALGADVVIAGMGPGVVGTGTVFGSTALEQGQILNAVYSLGGQGIAAVRLGFADARERHYGISHHALTVLTRVTLAPALVPLPLLKGEQREFLGKQLQAAGLARRHRVVEVDGEPALLELGRLGLSVTTMGRGPDEDPAFFLAAGAAGMAAARLGEAVKQGLPQGDPFRLPGGQVGAQIPDPALPEEAVGVKIDQVNPPL